MILTKYRNTSPTTKKISQTIMGSTVSIQRSATKEDFPKVKLVRFDAPAYDASEIKFYAEEESIDDWAEYIAFMNNGFNTDAYPQYIPSHHT